MADADRFKFSHKELAEILARYLHLEDGLWGLYVRFGIAASNVGPDTQSLNPAAIVPVVEIGLQRMEEPSNLTIDLSTPRRQRSTGARAPGARKVRAKAKPRSVGRAR